VTKKALPDKIQASYSLKTPTLSSTLHDLDKQHFRDELSETLINRQLVENWLQSDGNQPISLDQKPTFMQILKTYQSCFGGEL
jgi:hypothetical protein